MTPSSHRGWWGGLGLPLLLAPCALHFATAQPIVSTITYFNAPPAGLNPLGGDTIYVGGTNLNAVYGRGFYANYSNGVAGVAPFTTGPCVIQSATNMTCTSAPGYGASLVFTFWLNTSSLSPLTSSIVTVASYMPPLVTGVTVLGATGVATGASSLPLRVAGSLMIDLSAVDFNPATNLWDNKVTTGPVSTSNGDFGVLSYGAKSDNAPTKTVLGGVTAVQFAWSLTVPPSISTRSTPSVAGTSPNLFAGMYGTNPWSMEALVQASGGGGRMRACGEACGLPCVQGAKSLPLPLSLILCIRAVPFFVPSSPSPRLACPAT